MYRALLFALHLCCCLQAKAQLSDSLYKALPDSLRPKNKLSLPNAEIVHLMRSSPQALMYRFVNEFKVMALQLEKQIDQVKNKEDKMLYAFGVGEFYSKSGAIDQSQYWYNQVIAYGEGEKAHQRILCEAYLNRALNYAHQEKLDSAVSLLHKAANIATANHDSATIRDVYYVDILIYGNLNLYHKAIEFANKFLKAVPARDKWSSAYIEVMMTKANLYTRLYRDERKAVYADSAKALVWQVMEATKKEANYYYLPCYSILGILHYFMSDYSASLHYYDLALSPKYNQEGSYQAGYVYKHKLYRNLSLVRMGKGEGVKEVLSVDIPAKDYAARQELNKALSQYYSQQGDYQKALTHYTQYKLYADSSDIAGQKGKVFEAEQKYSVAQKEAAIAQLENKNLQAQVTRNTILVAVFIGLLLLYIYNKRQQARRLAERIKLTDELHTMEQEMELQRLQQQAETEAAIVGQRKEISKNMHDEVSSSLVALRYHVADMKKATPNDSTRHLLDSIEKELNSVYLQTRDLLYRMANTNPQKNYNVFDLLENLSHRFNANSGLQINVQADTNLQHLLNAQQNAELYRVIKEAVANSMKHSGANRVDISLSSKERTIEFSVRDNGRGMSADAGRGLGMATMKQRVEGLNGSLSVEPSATGTSIRGSFPVA